MVKGYFKRVNPAPEGGARRADWVETAADLLAGTTGGANEDAMGSVPPCGGTGTCVHKRQAGRRAGAMLAGPVTWQLPGKGGERWHGRTSRLRCSALERWATGWQPVLCAPASRRSSGTARWRRPGT